MQDRRGVVLAVQPAVVWPPDDTEESVLGTNLHQTAIRNLILGINEAAMAADPAGQAPWQAGDQTMIADFRRPDGSRYLTLPDVFVYRHAFDDGRGSLSVERDGPPLLIIEVFSEATYKNDVNLLRGKGYSYRRAGVQEYLTLDPTGAYLQKQGQGWMLEGERYRPWQRAADGLWYSRQIPLALGLEGALVDVRGTDGYRLLREGEIERERSRLRRNLAVEKRQRVEDLQANERQRREELAAKDAELAALRLRLAQLEQRE
jgi:hypothetical protein